MTTTYPPDAHRDAKNRAWRTFVVGMLVDVVAAVALAVGPALAGADIAWTRTYWVAIGTLAAGTAIKTAVAYVARRAVPPNV